MRPNIIVTLITFVSSSFAAGDIFRRQNAAACSSVTNACPSNGGAYRFCSDYLGIRPQRTTTKITVSTVTVSTATTAPTVSTNSCPTEGPRRKRAEPTVVEERNPTPIAEDENAALPVAKRFGTPACLSKYAATASKLSSACNCYSYAITSSTRTVTRYTTVPNAPTTTTYTATVTVTTLTSTPTCNVAYTDPKTGEETDWKEFYGVCFADRAGGNTPVTDPISIDPDTPLCEALNKCANAASPAGAQTFELSWNRFFGPAWACYGYKHGRSGLEFSTSDDLYETYGYYRS